MQAAKEIATCSKRIIRQYAIMHSQVAEAGTEEKRVNEREEANISIMSSDVTPRKHEP